MKRVFEIKWPDNCGPMWMNKDNLRSCLVSEAHVTNVGVTIRDLTDDELFEIALERVGERLRISMNINGETLYRNHAGFCITLKEAAGQQ